MASRSSAVSRAFLRFCFPPGGRHSCRHVKFSGSRRGYSSARPVRQWSSLWQWVAGGACGLTIGAGGAIIYESRKASTDSNDHGIVSQARNAKIAYASNFQMLNVSRTSVSIPVNRPLTGM